MKKGTILTALLLASLAAATALAGDERRERHRRGPDRFEEVMALPGLNLTEEQQERIRTLREAYREASKPLRERMIGKGRELRNLWLAQTPDRERIMAVQAEAQELRAQLSEKEEGYFQEARRLLTPEQRTRLEVFEVERRRHHERMMRGRPPGGGPPEERGMMGGERGGQ
jgi:Spy/CpxP family protein refolding chaperone